MKVSIIIAAYNAEQYLSETLDSAIHQSIDDYEVIVVDDGSTDHTVEILKEYQKRCDRLHVFQKENGGPSSARNLGMEHAKGEFFYFMDADDLIEPDSMEALYDAAVQNDAELVVAKYDIFNKYKTTPVHTLDELVKQEEIQRYDTGLLWTFSLCNKLFKASVIRENQFEFPPISYSEDGVFTMRFVYTVKRIAGLDKVVFHYRRMYDGESTSITSSVAPWKVRDYVIAHKTILELAEKSMLKDYPGYSSFEEAKEQNTEIHDYITIFIRKELQVLLNQFYMKFWSLDEESIQLIVTEFEERLAMLDIREMSLLSDAYPDLCLQHLPSNPQEALQHAFFTAVLYADEEQKEAFVECVKSLAVQNLIGLKIVLPVSSKKMLEEAELLHGNMFFVEAESEKELFHKALEEADTPYITFCDPKIIYVHNTFKFLVRRFIKSQIDFASELIYHQDYGQPQPIYLNRIALESFRTGIGFNEDLCLDNTLANKFFRTSLLKGRKIPKEDTILHWLPELYKKGYTAFYNDGIIQYADDQETFLEFITTEDSKPFEEKYLKDEQITLNSEDVLIKAEESYQKLQKIPKKSRKDRMIYKAVSYMRKHCKVKDQVLFFSIRKDGELEGNAKALYPYIKGKKVICAQMLPHDFLTTLKMYWYVITSKVIVTDDYVKYLRYFPLKKNQRVIQLWHACGAFKKFGQRGTNIGIATDVATHAQYNVACVSSEHIRPIYADAFSINFKKVKALGCPRTDFFFDEEKIQEKRQQIYGKYPEFQDKFIIIYAPTFRDVGNDRTVFTPKIDFEKLSAELLPNQMLLVCPHPVMKNAIVDKKYENIKVVRDFSTNDLMFLSDMLITDYSSVIFEYALLKKPIVFYCYDLPIYNRGFYLNYPKDLPGEVYEDQESLTAYLTDPKQHRLDEKYDRFIQRYMSACDGHSCERIAKLINDYMEEK